MQIEIIEIFVNIINIPYIDFHFEYLFLAWLINFVRILWTDKFMSHSIPLLRTYTFTNDFESLNELKWLVGNKEI